MIMYDSERYFQTNVVYFTIIYCYYYKNCGYKSTFQSIFMKFSEIMCTCLYLLSPLEFSTRLMMKSIPYSIEFYIKWLNKFLSKLSKRSLYHILPLLLQIFMSQKIKASYSVTKLPLLYQLVLKNLKLLKFGNRWSILILEKHPVLIYLTFIFVVLRTLPS